MSKFTTRFYRITHCGYFKYGASEPEIGGIQFFLEQLRAYATGKNLQETRVEGSGDRLTAYLFDVKQHGSCWVVTLWNEVPADQGAVASVPATAMVGGATVYSNPIAAGSIPGFPTYFLFIPEAEMVAPLIYGDSVFGLQQFKYYSHHFLENSTDIVHYKEDDDLVEILGYDDGSGNAREDVRARFEIQLKRGSSQAAAIIQRAASIRSIIRVAEINTITQPQRARFQKFLDFWSMTAAPGADVVRIRQEIPVTVTQDQVREMIDQLMTEELKPKRNDLAFKFERDSKEYWLSGGIPSGSYEVNVSKQDGVFPAEELAKAFSRKKTLLINDANP